MLVTTVHTLALSFIVNTLMCNADPEVSSTYIVHDPAGNPVGPQIELSRTVLRTDEVLSYTCREGTDAEENRLSRIDESGIYEFGTYSTKVCNYAVDPKFTCTIVYGDVQWKKEYGAKYACSASISEWYYIHWINPVVITSPNVDLDSSAYGSTQTFYCSVDMTPYDISYEDIITVTWRFGESQTSSNWSYLENDGQISSTIATQGANATLSIANYNPIKHGGKYGCEIGFPPNRFNTLIGNFFSVSSLPKATLKNNKRSSFTFGMYETVKFTCQALSYPFPEQIEFRLQSNVIDSNTRGVSNYLVDVTSTDVDKHTATFTVHNMSEVFHNDSVLECHVFRGGDRSEAISQTRILLVPVEEPRYEEESVSTVSPTAAPQPWFSSVSECFRQFVNALRNLRN